MRATRVATVRHATFQRQRPCLRRPAPLRCVHLNQPTAERPNRIGEGTGEFTPYVFLHYSRDPESFCRHVTKIDVNATLAHCFEIWNKWDNLLDFLDLIGEMLPQTDDPNVMTLFCYYRFGLLPIVQIMTVVKKIKVVENRSIRFEGWEGMPIGGIVEFEENEQGGTKVELRFEHSMPTCFLLAHIDRYSVQNHMQTILEENMATFKMLAEGDLEFSEEKYDLGRHFEEIAEREKSFGEASFENGDDDLEDEIANLKDLEDEMDDLEDFFKDLKDEIDNVEDGGDKIDDVTEYLKDLKDEIDDVENSLKDLEDEIDDVEDDGDEIDDDEEADYDVDEDDVGEDDDEDVEIEHSDDDDFSDYTQSLNDYDDME